MHEHEGPWTAATAPGGLPVLASGRHDGPDQGACVMEYVSVLAGEPWSDSPVCTDRALGELARWVNDGVGQDARSALVELAPRLVGAVGPAAGDVVVAAVARVGLENAPEYPALIRIRRRARARIAPPAPRSRVRARVGRLGCALAGTGLAATYLHLGRAVCGRPRAERDTVRVRALAEAIEDVRSHVEGQAGQPVGASAAPVPMDVSS
jgi:hypothetical protein